MKVIAFYLPQYYEFEENNRWWGKGFTEWTNVRKAVPLYKDHYQPTIPMNGNFYSLEKVSTMQWQVDLAKKYGVYGFCFYHYWFGDDRQLMEKPVDMYLEHRELDLPFCLCWANHNWTRTWIGGDKDILMDMKYGDQAEWEAHFNYLLPFFKDERYIRIDNKPVLVIYLPQDIPCFEEMKNYLTELAIKNGLEGITFVSQHCFDRKKIEALDLDYYISYEPNHFMQSYAAMTRKDVRSIHSLRMIVKRKIKKYINKLGLVDSEKQLRNLYDYDDAWKSILEYAHKDPKLLPCGFVNFDSSPRKNRNGVIFKGAAPDKFKNYFSQLVRKTIDELDKDYVFMTAWNEWGEGAYLEPDEKHGYEYLEAIKSVLDQVQ